MMAPSLLAPLTMLTVMIVVGMSVARERELGTFEQLLVSPLQPIEIIIGKAAPGMVIGMTEGTGLSDRRLPVRHSYHRLGFAAVREPGRLSLLGDRHCAVHFFAGRQPATGDDGHHGRHHAGDHVSGFASPVQNMPDWLQPFAMGNPLTHFLVIVRGVFLREMPADLVLQRLWPMAAIAVISITAASWLFRRRTQ